jgi:hypothetical protein
MGLSCSGPAAPAGNKPQSGVREAVFTEVPAFEPSPAPTDVAFDFKVFLALAPAFWTE